MSSKDDARLEAVLSTGAASARSKAAWDVVHRRIDLEAPDVAETALDALFMPGFRVKVFLLQMFIHLFYPLSLACYPRSSAPKGLRNQALRPWDMNAFAFVVTMSPILCWCMLGIFFWEREAFAVSKIGVDEIFTVPMVMLTARVAAIGVKYRVGKG